MALLTISLNYDCRQTSFSSSFLHTLTPQIDNPAEDEISSDYTFVGSSGEVLRRRDKIEIIENESGQ